jgi:hypothetical protein
VLCIDEDRFDIKWSGRMPQFDVTAFVAVQNAEHRGPKTSLVNLPSSK